MKKNAFTLVELLGVITILGLLMIVAIPSIVSQIKKTEGTISEATKNLIFNATQIYFEKNANEYQYNRGNIYCVQLQTLVDNNELDSNMLDINTGKKLDFTKVVKATIENRANIDYEIVNNGSCNEVVMEVPNKPVLTAGMTPVKWDSGNNELTTTEDDPTWYNYTEKRWANVRTADGSYWVWIPRYAYKIISGYHTGGTGVSGTIDIKFLIGKTNKPSDRKTAIENSGYAVGVKDTSMNYFLHPAFTFGDEEIEGFWVAKFEPSGSASNINIVPNVSSLRGMKIGDQFDAAYNMRNNSKYGWASSTVETNMMKNIDWGAVAYLSKSVYGANEEVWINPNINFTTGCAGTSVSAYGTSTCQAYNTANGVKASTTHNITGVYDMSGGAWEYVAAYVNNGHSYLTTYGNSIINANTKYKDVYIQGSSDTQVNNYTANQNKYGDAVYETSSTSSGYYSWYGNQTYMPYSSLPWFYRGGDYNSGSSAGVFSFDNDGGYVRDYLSFRPIVLVK